MGGITMKESWPEMAGWKIAKQSSRPQLNWCPTIYVQTYPLCFSSCTKFLILLFHFLPCILLLSLLFHLYQQVSSPWIWCSLPACFTLQSIKHLLNLGTYLFLSNYSFHFHFFLLRGPIVSFLTNQFAQLIKCFFHISALIFFNTCKQYIPYCEPQCYN